MAEQEQVEQLIHSIDEWNQWRQEQPEILPDLSNANLDKASLIFANLSNANLYRASLIFANLIGANLYRASLDRANFHSANLRSTNLHEAILDRTNLSGADLSNSNLEGADLSSANLTGANLSSANLINANLSNTNLYRANLDKADLSRANLDRADLSRANLDKADLTLAHFFSTIFTGVDLSNVKGLETAIHDGPSTVNINLVIFPYDKQTRLHFLRGVGFTETQIEYLPSLLTPQPIQYHSLFISYAHQDEAVAKRLHIDLRKNDVPCWFAPHDLKIGEKLRPRIDEAIHVQEKLLLILSNHSVASQWVEHEVETALGKECEGKPNVLFPLRLDDAVLKSTTGWASHIRLTRHIGDFTNWQDDTTYQKAFTKLLRDLKVDSPPTL